MAFFTKTIPGLLVFGLFSLSTLSQYSLLAKESRPSLYGLIVCDTLSQDIKQATVSDASRMKATLSEISTIAGLKRQICLLDGALFSPFRINQWLLSTQPTEHDVVFCYFGCHGFRTPIQQTPWPMIYFPVQENALDGEIVLKAIMEWKPRLIIVIFECCNGMAWVRAKGKTSLSTPKLSSEGIKKLFTQRCGIALACSASPGEKAFGVYEAPDFPTGGIFTTTFLCLLAQESSRPQPKWEAIFEKSGRICTILAKRLTNTVQTPYIKAATSENSCKN